MIVKLALTLLLTGYQYGGTFIGAVICSDGIVIAADSRTTFMDGAGQPFAYIDSMPKIYFDKGTAIAISGVSSVEGELFSSFVNRNRDLLLRPVNEVLYGFLLWMPFTNSSNIAMISAGFVDGKPMICSKAPIYPQNCVSSGYFSSKSSTLLRDMLTQFGRIPTTDEAAAALRAAIMEYSGKDLTVGGPINILKLTNAAPPQYSGTPPTDSSVTKICDLVRARRASIRPIGSPADLDRHLKAACP